MKLELKSELVGAAPGRSKLGMDEGALNGQLELGNFDRWALDRLFSAIGNPPVRLRLWSGLETACPSAAPVATVDIRDRTTLVKLLVYPELYFGEAYSSGRLEVEGPLVNFVEVMYRALADAPARHPVQQLAQWAMHRPRDTSLEDSKDNIHRHYNIGNDFYRLWLDEQMVYTCAYFRNPTYTLERAQIAKMDHVCRKLELKPSQKVVEAGCGWGSLALHMAKSYGVAVKAYNISRQQIAYARRRAHRLGLQDRVEFIEDDYRNIHGRFDAFVSVGMLEHAGYKHLNAFGEVIRRSLKDSGRGLIHFIGRTRPTALNPWIERHIFPGGYPPALSEVAKILEPGKFSVMDIENIRLHYAKTLEHWLTRFEQAVPRVKEMFGECFVRAWRLYLAGSIAAFSTGDMQLFQILFSHQGNNQVPWTREYLYRS